MLNMSLASQAVFLSIALAFIFSQGLKVLLYLRKGEFHLSDLAVTGGMPSSHSAVVTALSLSVFWTEGLSSLFFTTIVLGVIVIRDALGVRKTAGDEGKLLNEVIKRTKLRLPILRYSRGHKPEEVAVGVLIGLITTILAFYL